MRPGLGREGPAARRGVDFGWQIVGVEPGQLPEQVKAMGITGSPSGLMALFSSHPPIEQRIAALQGR